MRIDETFWTGGEGTLYVMIGFGADAVNSSTCDALFDSVSLFSSASGSQKKDGSEMGFMYGVTGDETNFMGGAIQRDLTC